MIPVTGKNEGKKPVNNRKRTSIFDWLTDPSFRQSPAMFLGKSDVWTLWTWIDGYVTACEDAGTEDRLLTPNGVSVRFLRDVVTIREKDGDDKDCLSILGLGKEKESSGPKRERTDRFFDRVDEFMRLSVQGVWRLTVTERMRQVYRERTNGSFPAIALRKTSLSEGLCWIMEERPDRECLSSQIAGGFWDERRNGFDYGAGTLYLVKEDYADRWCQAHFDEANWERLQDK